MAAAAFDPRGHLLAVVTAGAQTLEIVNPFTQRVIGGALNTGYGVRGVAVDTQGAIWVDASLSREVRVFTNQDGDWVQQDSYDLRTGIADPLSASLLRGKQLFHDSADQRLTAQAYVACASCHLDGESDGRVWDFTDRGEGLRNTPPLAGAILDGPLHWTANFDEVHDFENDIRDFQAGHGLLDEQSWLETFEPLGLSKAGYSEDLDALSEYVHRLAQRPLRSPWRAPDGSLSAEAQIGEQVFLSEATGCVDCHPPPTFTDSQWLSQATPLLHDVGTITTASGDRVGAPITGLDTPSLLGLHDSAPYLHDGRYTSLLELLENNPASHGSTAALTADELEHLAQYLLELE